MGRRRVCHYVYHSKREVAMKIVNVLFLRSQSGWICKLGFNYETAEQYTDLYHQVEVNRGWWLVAYWSARREARAYIRAHGAKPGERLAKGWN